MEGMKATTTYIAFLRGLNVGGNNLIPMKELATIGERAGLSGVRTCINSGNILFTSDQPEGELATALEKELAGKTGKEIRVFIRSAKELEQIVRDNPFPNAVPSQVGVMLVAGPVGKNVLAEFVISGTETVVVGKREIYVHYPDGMGRSKLKWPPSLKDGTMRNINTLTKLASLAAERSGG
ncbi:MAG: DUF1697 domain-containing protein [Methanoregula sp.]|jgi:uncharacterized protein (DUF1697 family)